MPGPDSLPPGPRRDLVEALHLLYRGAGMPGLRRIAKAVMDGDFRDTVSHEKVGKILRGDGLPSWTKLEPVVRILVNWNAARLDSDAEIIRIQELWQRARSLSSPEPDRVTGRAELDRLVGLEPFKAVMEELVWRFQLRQKSGLGDLSLPQFIFVGPPGTGKTRAARITGLILRDLGLLRRGNLVQISRGDLLGRHHGHTGWLVHEAAHSARDGVLFIDDALRRGSPEDVFESEFTDALLAEMYRDDRDLVVILAGNPRDVQHWGEGNPGLSSRFTAPLEFPPYTVAELVEILRLTAAADRYVVLPEVAERAAGWLEARRAADPSGFGNALAVRELFAAMETRMARRAATSSADFPPVFIADDVPNRDGRPALQ